ncbi:hypothetical protein QZH41_018068, partial [Actinostola sp. cb2023]
SIPVDEAINSAISRIHSPISHLTKRNIQDLLTVTLHNVYFTFQSKMIPPNRRTSHGIQLLETLKASRSHSWTFTVTITDQGPSTFEFYKKKAKKPLFVHYKSALPSTTKKITLSPMNANA